MAQGTVRAYEMAQKHGIQTGWGTDILFNPRNTPTQGRQLAKLTRFYDPHTLLGQATGRNGELLALSGARNPYPRTVGRIVPAVPGPICWWPTAIRLRGWTFWRIRAQPAPHHEGWQDLQEHAVSVSTC